MDVSVRIINGDMKSLNLLSSAGRYIHWVALQNCCDYFEEVEVIGKNITPIIKKNREPVVFRLFLNSIESLNNIVDYLYFDKFKKQFKSFECYKMELLGRYAVLNRINEIANAYKHCERRDTKKLCAKDIQFDHAVLVEAFKFWIKYHQEDGNIELFQDK